MKLTLEKFDHKGLLHQIPVLEFDAKKPDYWLLLPVFEEIEEETGKLIDLGESLVLNEEDIAAINKLCSKKLDQLGKSDEEEHLLQTDEEVLEDLLRKLHAMTEMALSHKVNMQVISEE